MVNLLSNKFMLVYVYVVNQGKLMINQVGRLEGAPWLRPHFGEFLD